MNTSAADNNLSNDKISDTDTNLSNADTNLSDTDTNLSDANNISYPSSLDTRSHLYYWISHLKTSLNDYHLTPLSWVNFNNTNDDSRTSCVGQWLGDNSKFSLDLESFAGFLFLKSRQLLIHNGTPDNIATKDALEIIDASRVIHLHASSSYYQHDLFIIPDVASLIGIQRSPWFDPPINPDFPSLCLWAQSIYTPDETTNEFVYGRMF